jgi:hypothetical protein
MTRPSVWDDAAEMAWISVLCMSAPHIPKSVLVGLLAGQAVVRVVLRVRDHQDRAR